MIEYTKEELKKIEDQAIYYSNDCGGCETCSQVFGYKPPYDPEHEFRLVSMIETRDKKIKELEDLLYGNIQRILGEKND